MSLKSNATSQYRADPAILNSLKSVGANPRFKRVILFSIQVLSKSMTNEGTKNKDNCNCFVNEKGEELMLKVMDIHKADDELLYLTGSILLACLQELPFEVIGQKFINAGTVKTIQKVLDDPSKKSDETVRILMEILDKLSDFPNLHGKIIDQMGLNIFKKVIQHPNPEIIKMSLNSIVKLSNNPISIKPVSGSGIVNDLLKVFQEKKCTDPAIISKSMRIFNATAKTAEVKELLKKEFPVGKVVELMEQFADDKNTLNVGSALLGKLATDEDLDKVMKEASAGNEQAAKILSNLVLVDDMMDKMAKKNGVSNIMSLIHRYSGEPKVAEQKAESVKHCLVALGRIASGDPIQARAIIKGEGKMDLLKAMKMPIATTQTAALESLACIAVSDREAAKEIGKSELLPNTVELLIERKESPKAVEAALQILTQTMNDEETVKVVAQKNGAKAILAAMKAHPTDKSILEKGAKALCLYVTNEKLGNEVLENGGPEFLLPIVKQNQAWKKLHVNTMNLMQTLMVLENAVPAMVKSQGLEAIVAVMHRADQQTQEESLVPGESAEVLTAKQTSDLKATCKSVLSKLADKDSAIQFKEQLFDINKRILGKPDRKISAELQEKISTMACINELEGVAETFLREDAHEPLIDIARKIANANDYPDKDNHTRDVVKLFNSLVKLNVDDKTKTLFRSKKIGPAFAEFLGQSLNKNTNPRQALVAIKGIQAAAEIKMSNAKAEAAANKRMSVMGVSTADDQRPIAKLVDGILSSMSKFRDNEEVMVASVEGLRNLIDMNTEIATTVNKAGGLKILLERVSDPLTTKKAGAGIMMVLEQVSKNSKELTVALANQKAIPTIMSSLTLFKNDPKVAAAASGLLKKLATVENADQGQSMESGTKELCKKIEVAATGKKMSAMTLDERMETVEFIDSLGSYMILDKNVATLNSSKGLKSLNDLLVKELSEPETVVAEMGFGSSHERILKGISDSFRACALSPQGIKSGGQKQLMEVKGHESLIKVLLERNNFKEAVMSVSEVLSGLVSNEECKKEMIKSFQDYNIAPVLNGLLEKYKEEPPVMKPLNKLAAAMSVQSKTMASKLNQGSLVKSMVKDLKNSLKEQDLPETIESMKECIESISALAEVSQNMSYIVEEGVTDILIASLKKENIKAEETQDAVDIEKAAYDLDIEDNIEIRREEEESVGVTTNIMMLLEKITEDEENLEKVGKDELLEELLNTLKMFGNEKQIALSALRNIRNLCSSEAIAEKFVEMEAVDVVMSVINKHPINSSFKEIVGEVLSSLGGEEMIPDVRKQLIEASETFDIDDPDVKEIAEQSAIYLGNLSLIPREEEEAIKKTEKKEIENVIAGLASQIEEINAKKTSHMKLIASQLICIGRMAARDEFQREKLLQSDVMDLVCCKVLDENPKIISGRNGQFPGIFADAIKSIVGPKIEKIKIIDEETGAPLIFPREGDLGKLKEYLGSEDLNCFENLLQMIDPRSSLNKDKPIEPEAKTKVVESLANMAFQDQDLANLMLENDIVEKLENFLSEIQRKSHYQERAPEALSVAQKLLENLIENCDPDFRQEATECALDSAVFESTIELFKNASIPPNLSLQSSPPNPVCLFQELANGLDLIKEIANNKFDKKKLMDGDVPAQVLGLVNEINEISENSYNSNPYLAELLSKGADCLAVMLKDPMISRSLVRNEISDVLGASLMLASPKVSKKQKFSLEKAKVEEETDEVTGEEDKHEQALESVIDAIRALSTNEKVAKKMTMLNDLENGETIQHAILEAQETTCKNVVNAVNIGLIHKNLLKAIPPAEIKANKEEVEGILEYSERLAEIYPKIPILKTIAEDVGTLLKGELLNEDLKKKKMKEKKAESITAALDDLVNATVEVKEGAVKIKGGIVERKPREVVDSINSLLATGTLLEGDKKELLLKEIEELNVMAKKSQISADDLVGAGVFQALRGSLESADASVKEKSIETLKNVLVNESAPIAEEDSQSLQEKLVSSLNATLGTVAGPMKPEEFEKISGAVTSLVTSIENLVKKAAKNAEKLIEVQGIQAIQNALKAVSLGESPAQRVVIGSALSTLKELASVSGGESTQMREIGKTATSTLTNLAKGKSEESSSADEKAPVIKSLQLFLEIAKKSPENIQKNLVDCGVIPAINSTLAKYKGTDPSISASAMETMSQILQTVSSFSPQTANAIVRENDFPVFPALSESVLRFEKGETGMVAEKPVVMAGLELAKAILKTEQLGSSEKDKGKASITKDGGKAVDVLGQLALIMGKEDSAIRVKAMDVTKEFIATEEPQSMEKGVKQFIKTLEEANKQCEVPETKAQAMIAIANIEEAISSLAKKSEKIAEQMVVGGALLALEHSVGLVADDPNLLIKTIGTMASINSHQPSKVKGPGIEAEPALVCRLLEKELLKVTKAKEGESGAVALAVQVADKKEEIIVAAFGLIGDLAENCEGAAEALMKQNLNGLIKKLEEAYKENKLTVPETGATALVTVQQKAEKTLMRLDNAYASSMARSDKPTKELITDLQASTKKAEGSKANLLGQKQILSPLLDAINNRTKTPEGVAEFIKENGISTMVATQSACTEDPELALKASAALKQVLKTGVPASLSVPLLSEVKTMSQKLTPSSSKPFETLLDGVCSLTTKDSGASSLLSNKGLEILANAAKSTEGFLEIQEKTLETLKTLVDQTKSAKVKAGSSSGENIQGVESMSAITKPVLEVLASTSAKLEKTQKALPKEKVKAKEARKELNNMEKALENCLDVIKTIAGASPKQAEGFVSQGALKICLSICESSDVSPGPAAKSLETISELVQSKKQSAPELAQLPIGISKAIKNALKLEKELQEELVEISEAAQGSTVTTGNAEVKVAIAKTIEAINAGLGSIETLVKMGLTDQLIQGGCLESVQEAIRDCSSNPELQSLGIKTFTSLVSSKSPSVEINEASTAAALVTACNRTLETGQMSGNPEAHKAPVLEAISAIEKFAAHGKGYSDGLIENGAIASLQHAAALYEKDKNKQVPHKVFQALNSIENNASSKAEGLGREELSRMVLKTIAKELDEALEDNQMPLHAEVIKECLDLGIGMMKVEPKIAEKLTEEGAWATLQDCLTSSNSPEIELKALSAMEQLQLAEKTAKTAPGLETIEQTLIDTLLQMAEDIETRGIKVERPIMKKALDLCLGLVDEHANQMNDEGLDNAIEALQKASGGDPEVMGKCKEIEEKKTNVLSRKKAATKRKGSSSSEDGGKGAIATNPELLDKLEAIADMLEDLTEKKTEGSATPEESKSLNIILDKVAEMAQNPEKGSSLLNFGITESAQKLISAEKNVEPETKAKAMRVIKELSKHKEHLPKLADQPELTAQLVGVLGSASVEIEKGSALESEKALVLETLETIQHFSKNEEAMDSLIKVKVIPTVLKTMSMFKEDPQVVESILETTSVVTVDSKASEEFQASKGLEMINDTFEKFVDVLSILRKIARQIGDLAMTPEDQTAIVQKGYVDKLNLGLSKYPLDTELDINTCYALERITKNHNDNRKALITHPVIDLVLNMLKQKIEEKELVGQIGLLAAGLAFGTPNKTTLGKKGFMDSLGKAFEFYKANFDEDTLVKVLKGIGNLASVVQNATIFIKEGHVTKLRDIMEKNLMREELIIVSCATIGNLAFEKFEKNYSALVKEGAVGILGRVIFGHEENPKVLSFALDAVGNLCHNAEISQMIANLGAIEAIVRILKSLDYDRDLTHKALKCLRRMSITQSTINKLMESSGQERILSCLKSYKDDTEVLNECLKTIKNCIADQNDNKARVKAMHEAGLSEIIFDIFDTEKWTKESIRETFSVLSLMATTAEASAIYAEKGSVHSCAAIRKHIADDQTVREGINLFSLIMESETNTQHFANVGGIELISEVLSKYPANAKICLPVARLSFSFF